MSGLLQEDRVGTRADTRHRDYILTDYEPRCDPGGRLHCASAYRHGLRAAGMLEGTWPVIESLQAHLGRDQTVWGLKYTPAGVGTELYFYNNRNNPPGHPMAVNTLVERLAPRVRIGSHADEHWPYFMCSFELDAAALARCDAGAMRVYLGSGEKNRTPGGFSYRLDGEQPFLENHYAFYYAARPAEVADVRGRLAFSTRAGSRAQQAALLPDYLLECRTVCYAVKPRYDGLYFSRISTAQLTRFLEAHLPGPLLEALRAEPDGFAHLNWDLGYDFACPQAGPTPIHLDKIAVYGVV